VENNNQQIIDQLLKPEFDFTKKLVLEENLGFIPPEKAPTKEGIKWLEYKPNVLKLAVKTDQSGFLFLSDNFYPGWRAFVDGVETKIYRANFTFRAVPLSPGEHEVKFIYEPLLFKIGLYLSWGTLILLIGGSFGIYKFRKEWW
jgi:uncharacterized membrane protein YfhO